MANVIANADKVQASNISKTVEKQATTVQNNVNEFCESSTSEKVEVVARVGTHTVLTEAEHAPEYLLGRGLIGRPVKAVTQIRHASGPPPLPKGTSGPNLPHGPGIPYPPKPQHPNSPQPKPGGGVAVGSDGQILVGVHGNSNSSMKLHHAYEIFIKATQDVVKNGISGQKLSKNGTSPRANPQVKEFNEEAGACVYDSRITKTGLPGRRKATAHEVEHSQELRAAGHSMSKHKRP